MSVRACVRRPSVRRTRQSAFGSYLGRKCIDFRNFKFSIFFATRSTTFVAKVFTENLKCWRYLRSKWEVIENLATLRAYISAMVLSIPIVSIPLESPTRGLPLVLCLFVQCNFSLQICMVKNGTKIHYFRF